MIPYSSLKLSDLYTLSQTKLLENHTLHSGTYLYSPYMALPQRGLEIIFLSAGYATFWMGISKQPRGINGSTGYSGLYNLW